MKDGLVFAALVLGFAAVVTLHVALAMGLFWRRRPRWHGVVALVVPPLGLIWAFKAGWRKLAFSWLGALAIYGVALVVALSAG